MRSFHCSLTVAALCLLGGCENPQPAPLDSALVRDSMPVAAPAEVPADVPSYVTAKADYVARCEAADGCPGMKDALKDLEARLRAIIGAIEMENLQWSISLDALPTKGNEGGAQLDGLSAPIAGGVVLVSTPDLLDQWLKFRADSGADPLQSLASEDVLTQALYDGAHIYRFVDVAPKAKLPKDVFTAQMIHQSQDTPGSGPDRIVVGVLRGGRIFLFKVPAAVSLPSSKTCASEYTEGYRYCYDSSASTLPGFRDVVKQVQALVALLPT